MLKEHRRGDGLTSEGIHKKRINNVPKVSQEEVRDGRDKWSGCF